MYKKIGQISELHGRPVDYDERVTDVADILTDRAILLTIKREYAEEILARRKPTEYRTRPPRISQPTRTHAKDLRLLEMLASHRLGAP